MVDARNQRAAAFVVLNEMKLPQRTRWIQRRRRELAGEFLQCRALALAAAPAQCVLDDVVRELERVVVDPACAHRVLHDLLTKAPVLQQLVVDSLGERFVADGRIEQPHADDHHQVHVVVHPQPGGVHARHAFGGGRHGESPLRHVLGPRWWVTSAQSMAIFTDRSTTNG